MTLKVMKKIRAKKYWCPNFNHRKWPEPLLIQILVLCRLTPVQTLRRSSDEEGVGEYAVH